jgi:GT2 family glycosyltransferase
LNPDTIVRPGALRTLIQFMKQTPNCGIAGSRLEDPDGTVQRSAFRFPSVFSEFESAARTGPISQMLSRFVIAPPPTSEAIETDWVAGASMIVRCDVFDDVELMDEGFFLYYEEVDFCKRAKDAGWECWYVPASRVIHLVGQSTGVTNQDTARRRRPAYWFHSRRRYFLRHLGWFRSMLADLGWLSGAAIHCTRCALSGRSTNMPSRFVADFIANSVLFHPRKSVLGD